MNAFWSIDIINARQLWQFFYQRTIQSDKDNASIPEAKASGSGNSCV